MTDYLYLFLNKTFSGCSNESISRLNRLRFSLGQDLDYGIVMDALRLQKVSRVLMLLKVCQEVRKLQQ